MSVCGKCNTKVYFMEQVAYKGGFWHKNCFTCATCKKQLEPGTFLDHDNVPFCTSCFNKQFKPKGYGYGSNNLHSFEGKKGELAAGQTTGANASAARAGSPDLGAKGLAKPASPSGAAVKPAAASSTKPASPAKQAPSSSTISASSAPSAKSAAAKSVAAADKPEVNKLDKDRWYIENFDGKKSKRTDPIIINVAEVKQSVYIGKCNNVVIQIKGKCKQVTISGCQECGIQCDTVVATVELINSKKCQVQPTDKVGLIQLDGCERTSVYLSQICLDEETKIFTAKSNATLVYTPQPDGDVKELSLPEQFISSRPTDGSKSLVNEIVMPEALLS